MFQKDFIFLIVCLNCFKLLFKDKDLQTAAVF